MMQSTWTCLVGLAVVCASVFASENVDPVRSNYTVSDGHATCIVMATGIRLKIPYVGTNKNYTTIIDVPANTTGSSGKCQNSDGSETLTIQVYPTFTVTLVFGNSSVNPNSYEWKSISLTYKLDGAHFPNATNTGQPISEQLLLANGSLSSTFGGSFSCQGRQDFVMNDGTIFTLSDLQYRAFGVTDSTVFSESNVQHCSADDEDHPNTDLAIAIPVGIALAACIVIVVVIYVVASRVRGPEESGFSDD
ncbi:lysosome-associated membrane glycoprotein 2-like isoform X2 [Mya arenaria]|uniref:lysosome-associated membrane glycoprotein 2-like isoform X2 n=1 Tax=Mya arenaria TaxID=6604 RepID=UPI0022E0FADF|nr:lysosome-associated membrane glycoprotein 2-like isoform X2 [Mya arenaria]